MDGTGRDLDNELKITASAVTHLIREDSFPDNIRPEELRDAVRAYPSAGGKRLRPALLLWSCGMSGGDPEKALPAAAAVEIYHNWTLVHDDIIDGDEQRRGMPSCHAALARYAREKFGATADIAEKFGKDLAILTGDIQQAWAFDMLLRLTSKGVSHALTLALARRMQLDLGKSLLSGEALDVESPLRTGIDEENVLEIMSGKTSALLRYCLQAGAAIALDSADFQTPAQRLLAEFADALGAAFQIQDDLLGVYGNTEDFGKPLCSDFQENKKTLLLLAAEQRLGGAGRAELDSLSGLPEYTPETAGKIRTLLTGCGAEQAVRDRAAALTRRALDILEKLPENRWRTLLKKLTEHLLERKT